MLDSLLREFKTDFLRIWMPIAAGATMIVGLFVGISIQGCRDSKVQLTTSICSQERSDPFVSPQIEARKKITSPSSISPPKSHLRSGR